MRQPALLENTIRDYAWGSHRALAELQGRAAPTREPEAELWMGAHPGAPSRVVIGDERPTLLELIEKDPDAWLGAGVAAAFGGRLPFLFKVIAAEKPLSIQAHPNARQAAEGFAREDAEGIPRDAPHRSYRDASHKPEIVCGLTRFEALRGFRPASEIRALLERLAVPALAFLERRLDAGGEGEPWRGTVDALLTLPAPERERVVADTVAAASRYGDDPALAWLPRLHAEYDHDVGVLAPLLLNFVVLEPGVAMYLPAGELHAYLDGVAVELMANSDNVLRGGLTPKHVDVPELLRVLRFEQTQVELLRPDAPGHAYASPTDEFRLSQLRVRPGSALTGGAGSLEILLCAAGAARVRAASGPALPLERGRSCVLPAAAGPCRIEGDAALYRASVP